MLRRPLLFSLVLGSVAGATFWTSAVLADGVKRLPTSVTEVVDTSGSLSVACVETEPGGGTRGGWWDSGNPGSVELCDLLVGGTFVDPAACNANDAATIVGRADVGPGGGGFPQVPVFCRSGSTTQLTYFGTFYNGKAHCVSANGSRIWGELFSAIWYPFLWREDGTIAWNSSLDAWWVGNFSGITQIEFLDCSADGRYACGWYEWTGLPGERYPFVVDVLNATTFEDCFGGNTQLHQGEARCVSDDGSKVYVYRFDNDKTYQTNCQNPVPNLAIVADGQPLYCSDDGTRVVGYTVDGAVDVGWIWKQGSGQSDLETVAAYDGLRPSCFDGTGKQVGGVLQNGVDAGGLWRDNKFNGFSALLACRDSLNKTFPNYEFSNVAAISEDGRTFYCDGQSSGSDRWFYCDLSDQKQFVWKEKSRGDTPAQITENCYLAYYYCILAASETGNAYFSLSQAYAEAGYGLDASCRNVKYDYWDGKAARKTYKNLRNQQLQYEYYCLLYTYYGASGAPTYGNIARAYANAAYQAILADL